MKLLKTLRAEHELTQSKLAKVLNLSRTSISMYETGNAQPDFSTVLKIADYFDVSVDYLIGRENKEMIERTEQRPAITTQEQEYLDAINALNFIGQIKAMAYIQGLRQSKEFTL